MYLTSGQWATLYEGLFRIDCELTERRGGGLVGTLLQAARSPLAWLGSFGLAAAMLCWLKVLSRVEIALVYPIFIGSGSLGVMLASSLVLRERIGLRRWLGTGLMLLGVIAASLE